MAKAEPKARRAPAARSIEPLDESITSVDGLFPALPNQLVTKSRSPAKGDTSDGLRDDVHALVAQHGTAAVLAAFRRVEAEATGSADASPSEQPAELSEAQLRALKRRAKWADRTDPREPVAKFLSRVYSDVLNKGLKQEHFRQIDRQLYDYLRKRDLPAELGLTSRWDESERAIERLMLPIPRSVGDARAMHAYSVRWLRKFGVHR